MNIAGKSNQVQKTISANIREYTHKNHDEEIFILGMTIIDNNKVIVKCSFENNHKHYSDVVNFPQLLNPMVLLESCRQAETYVAHQLFSVDESTKFILNSWSLNIVKENYLKFHGNSYRSFDICVETSQPSSIRTRLRKNKYYFTVKVDEVIIAKAEFDVGYINDCFYSIMRGKASSCNNVCNIPRLSPALVGYLSAYNTMLSNFEKYDGRYQALINVNLSNVTYNDHAQDHITGMNIVEAAKQFSFCYLSKVLELNNNKYQMSFIEAEYYSYVELSSHAYVSMKEVTKFNNHDYKFVLHIIQDENIKAKCEIFLTSL